VAGIDATGRSDPKGTNSPAESTANAPAASPAPQNDLRPGRCCSDSLVKTRRWQFLTSEFEEDELFDLEVKAN
jgi:hypothetical protein